MYIISVVNASWSLSRHDIFSVLCVKQGIAERNGVDFLHVRIIIEVGVDEEEYRHINLLSSTKHLLFKAEALDFVEVLTSTVRRDIVRCDADNIFLCMVLGSIERQCRFSRHHSDLSKLGLERPLQGVRGVGFKRDSDASTFTVRYQSLRGKPSTVGDRSATVPCACTEDTVQWHSSVRDTQHRYENS